MRADHTLRKPLGTLSRIAWALPWQSALYRDSLFLVLANVASAGFGFLFWTVAARLYESSDVGFAAAVISAIGLLAMLAALGFDYALIRFLPGSKFPQDIINASLTIASGGALVLAMLFLAGLRVWSPALLPVRANSTLVVTLVIAVVLTAASGILASTYLSRKRAWFVLAQSLVFGISKVSAAITFAVVGLHVGGLVGAWGIGLLALVVCGLVLFLPQALDGRYRFQPLVIRDVVNSMAHYAFSNYVVAVLWTAPMVLLPILIINLLGPEANAYFYVASSIAGLLAMIPTAISTSLFAHGSHDAADLTHRSAEAAKVSLALLVPAVVAVILAGDKLLLLFGRAYAEAGARLLWVLAGAALPLSVNFLYFSVLRIQQRMAGVIAGTAWVLIVTVGLTTYLLPRFGLLGAGVAWLAAQTTLALVILVRVRI